MLGVVIVNSLKVFLAREWKIIIGSHLIVYCNIIAWRTALERSGLPV